MFRCYWTVVLLQSKCWKRTDIPANERILSCILSNVSSTNVCLIWQSFSEFQSDWCTSFSNGYHKMSLILTETGSRDDDNPDPCLQFRIENITGTNLFLLMMGNRQMLNCNDQAYQVSANISIAYMSNSLIQFFVSKLFILCNNLHLEIRHTNSVFNQSLKKIVIIES